MTAEYCHRHFVHVVTMIPSTCLWAWPGHTRSFSYWSNVLENGATIGLTRSHVCGVIVVTHMPRSTPPPSDPKVAALRRVGALHPHPDRVHDERFLHDPFFDPRDRVQVKYEMVRRHRIDGRPVTEVAATFSVSRQAFYEAAGAFEAQGLPGLLPRRPGPKRAHKCTEEILAFAEQWPASDEERGDADVTAAITRRFHVTIHPRSLGRALTRRKKKRPAQEASR